MVGCRSARRTRWSKNYLWFAEKAGAQVLPEHEVGRHPAARRRRRQRRLSRHDRAPGAWFNKQRAASPRRGVVVSAGASGTNRLLAKCKHGGSLPGISDQLGELVRTNSESILAVTLPDDRLNPANDVAHQRQHPSAPDTHIEFVTYGAKGDFMSTQFTMITGDGTR
jgi:cholesterol oxidase